MTHRISRLTGQISTWRRKNVVITSAKYHENQNDSSLRHTINACIVCQSTSSLPSIQWLQTSTLCKPVLLIFLASVFAFHWLYNRRDEDSFISTYLTLRFS